MTKYQKMSFCGHLKRRVLTEYVGLIKNMYTNVVTSVGTCDRESNTFSIKIRLH
jgi:hypothetical protein